LACIEGNLKHTDTKAIGPLSSLFGKPVVQLSFVSGYSLFFEVMEVKALKAIVREHRPPSAG